LEHVAAYGICCDVCELHKKLGVSAAPALEVAKEMVRTRWGGKNGLCLVLDCTFKRGVAYCMRDCEEFPCQKYHEWCFSYGKDYLEMHKQRSKQEKPNEPK